jgi:hypothetical protein
LFLYAVVLLRVAMRGEIPAVEEEEEEEEQHKTRLKAGFHAPACFYIPGIWGCHRNGLRVSGYKVNRCF